jgi:hypothetical protein
MFSMYNKYTIALYVAVISSMLVASLFAITLVQQAATAQRNQSSSSNKTSAGGGVNTTSGAMTGAGAVTGGAVGGKK